MYSWRAHIGLISPGSGPNMERDFHRFLPPGVAVATTRIPFAGPSVEGLKDMADQLEEACKVFKRWKHDVIMFGCTSGSLIGGLDFDKQCIKRIEEVTGDPGMTTTTAVLEAFKALGVSKAATITPYPDVTNEIEQKFLEHHGITVTHMSGMGNDSSKTSIANLEPSFVYQKVKAMPKDGADCVFVSCTGLNILDLIPLFEEDFGVPVITSNQATLWGCLRHSGVGTKIPELGKLFTL